MSAEIVERSPGRIVYFVVTPVGVPTPWLEATAALEPTLTFEHEFMEESEQEYGRMRYERGKLVRDDDIEPKNLPWLEFEEDED